VRIQRRLGWGEADRDLDAFFRGEAVCERHPASRGRTTIALGRGCHRRSGRERKHPQAIKLRSPFGPSRYRQEDRMAFAFVFKLEHADGSPADPPEHHTAVPNWRIGDMIPLPGEERFA
jgi:hypothetical protein